MCLTILSCYSLKAVNFKLSSFREHFLYHLGPLPFVQISDTQKDTHSFHAGFLASPSPHMKRECTLEAHTQHYAETAISSSSGQAGLTSCCLPLITDHPTAETQVSLEELDNYLFGESMCQRFASHSVTIYPHLTCLPILG